MLYQTNPITQRDIQAAAADLMQNNPELFAQIENLRRQNRAQIQRGVAAFLTGKPQPAGIPLQSVFTDNDDLAKRRSDLEKQRNDLIKKKLEGKGGSLDLLKQIIDSEGSLAQSGVSAEATGAAAAIQARADLTRALMGDHQDTAQKFLELTAEKAPDVQNFLQGNEQAAKSRQAFHQAAQAAAANPAGLAAAYQNNFETLPPELRRMQAAALKMENPKLFEAVSEATGDKLAGDLTDYVVANQVELARNGALTQHGLSVLQEIDLPPSYYTVEKVKGPDGEEFEVKRLNEKFLQTGGYSAFNARKGQGMREMLDELKWRADVQNLMQTVDNAVDPVLAGINRELKDLKTTTAGVDAPTVTRATLRSDADVRQRAAEYAQQRLAARADQVGASDASDKAKARRLGRISSQQELLASDAPILGTRQKLATQKAQRMLRRGTRVELKEDGQYQQKSAPMSLAQQSAMLGSRSKPGGLTQEMETGLTAAGAESKDYEKGSKPLTAAGDAAKTGLAGLGQSLVKARGGKEEDGEEEAKAAKPKEGEADEDLTKAASKVSQFFGPNASRNRMGVGLRQKFRSRRSLFDDLEGDDVEEEIA